MFFFFIVLVFFVVFVVENMVIDMDVGVSS